MRSATVAGTQLGSRRGILRGAAPCGLLRLLLATSLAGLLPLAACGDGEVAWQLTWQDEFEGALGDLPDPSRWRFDVGTDWGNAQLEYDTDRPTNVALDGEGNLNITARRESYRGSDFTSGRIKTQGLFEQAGGRFEARIKLPSGQGVWPAFWLLGSGIDSVGWPECGEIDIMEFRGQHPRVIHGSLHGPGYFAGRALTTSYELSDGGFDEDFHVFAVEWGEDAIEWFVDGALYHRVTKGDVPGRWVFDGPFFVILNVAVGGGFVGPPSDATPFPQTMVVDWVRAYQAGQ